MLLKSFCLAWLFSRGSQALQAAYLTKHPEEFSTSFWSSLPHGTFYPLWILATFASIIASQALISASFQIVKQAIAQGFFPRFTVVHTSKKVNSWPFQQTHQCLESKDELFFTTFSVVFSASTSPEDKPFSWSNFALIVMVCYSILDRSTSPSSVTSLAVFALSWWQPSRHLLS